MALRYLGGFHPVYDTAGAQSASPGTQATTAPSMVSTRAPSSKYRASLSINSCGRFMRKKDTENAAGERSLAPVRVPILNISHATVEKIVETAREKIPGQPAHLIIGGTHLLPAQDEKIHRIANTLRDDHAVRWLAAAHCTGEPAFEILQQAFGERYQWLGPLRKAGPFFPAGGGSVPVGLRDRYRGPGTANQDNPLH
jgi:metal-dependent hydrolase (beta-lactamase superfamily II)